MITKNTSPTPEIAKHFSSRSEVYDTHGTWVQDNSVLTSISSFLPESPSSPIDIVDLGSGTGSVAKHILDRYSFCKSITAVDICEDMLSKIADTAIVKSVASVDSLPYTDNSFDFAVSRQCFHYVENLSESIKELKRVIKSGGIFVLSQIVPLETEVKHYWSEVIRFRQPLRKHFFSESDWVKAFSDEDILPLDVKRNSHRGSVMKWAKKYKIDDKTMIDEYKRLLNKAPKQFIDEYSVTVDEQDVSYNSFWVTIKFQNE